MRKTTVLLLLAVHASLGCHRVMSNGDSHPISMELQTSVVGYWIAVHSSTQLGPAKTFLCLRADGTFALRFESTAVTVDSLGHYRAEGTTVTLITDEGNATMLDLDGDTLVARGGREGDELRRSKERCDEDR